ncbi:hypothetical protein [Prosthecobacter sp.]|uniref:hypothetical protein n=1 Tax=Prosthecobacter sp. TaxID=1965333 RepID=UPI002ABCB26F|nr:hypothetical protein [Prosthecobacter sp.]MDZ4404031.1 hypothetical protein [Prosthecobacter sp.]
MVIGLDPLKGLNGDPRVTDTQVRQTGPRSIGYLFCAADGMDSRGMADEIMASMRACLDMCECQQVICTVRHVPFLEPSPNTGKVERWVPFRV